MCLLIFLQTDALHRPFIVGKGMLSAVSVDFENLKCEVSKF